MPNIKSAIKRVSVTDKKTQANKIQKSAIRSTVRKAKVACASADSDSATIVSQAIVKIDKAVAKGYMHKNTAARRKSKLTKAVNAMK
jgi:small subunit ribosomal protein S20